MDHHDWIGMRQFLRRQVLHVHLPGHYPLPTAVDIMSTDEEIAVVGGRERRIGGTVLCAARSWCQDQAECENYVSCDQMNGWHLSHSKLSTNRWQTIGRKLAV